MNVLPGVPDSLLNDPYRPAWERPPVTGISESEIRAGLAAEAKRKAAEATAPVQSTITPTDTAQTGNVLRPVAWSDIIGQDRTKALLKRLVERSQASGRVLDHVLLVGPSGTGKTTFAHVIANAVGAQVYQLEAPVSQDTLLELREVMRDGDILFLDEVHQQSLGDRRGRQSSTQPEVLFSIMEDRTIPTGQGVLPFPEITVMGATTDEGALPDAFINRFPIRPVLTRYDNIEMALMATFAARKLGIQVKAESAFIFAEASRRVPREITNFIRLASTLTDDEVTPDLATEIVRDLCGLTDDGLTRDMQEMLKFLYTRCKKYTKSTDETSYKSSVSNIATGIGKSRDAKAIQLRVEPHLIEQGLIQVGHGGRWLTDAGIKRAKELLG